MSILELSQLLRHQEHMLSYAEETKDKANIKYHKNLIHFFANKMIRIQNKRFKK